jgi:hypothetical protein
LHSVRRGERRGLLAPQALVLAEPRGMRPLVAYGHLGLATLYRLRAKREQAQQHLSTGTTMYHEIGMTYWLEQGKPSKKLDGGWD